MVRTLTTRPASIFFRPSLANLFLLKFKISAGRISFNNVELILNLSKRRSRKNHSQSRPLAFPNPPKSLMAPSKITAGGPSQSSREASRTASSVASALKSAFVEVQNQFKASRSPKRRPKSEFAAQLRPNLSQHGSNLEAQTLPNRAKSFPKSMQAGVRRRRREKT